MIYKFKSKAAGDLIFLPENARQVLSILGKADVAQGIIEPTAMAAAVLALQAAVAHRAFQVSSLLRYSVWVPGARLRWSTVVAW